MSFDLPGLFGAGLLTFLSPCVLPLVPLYLSFLAGASISGAEGERPRRPLAAALAFSLGLGVVFVALGMAATAVGGALSEHRTSLLRFGGLALFLFGLKQLGVISVPWLDREARPWLGRVRRGGSAVSGFLFGAAFALGWTPCIGPVLGGVLTYTAAATSSPARGALYLGTYAAGLAVPLIAAAFAAPWALGWMSRARRHLRKIELATGALLAVLGLLLFNDALGVLAIEPGSDSPQVTDGRQAAASGLSARATGAAEGAPRSAPPTAGEPSSGGGSTAAGGAVGAECASEASGEAACALPESAGPDWLATEPSSLDELSRPTMVEFVSRSCPVCERMKPLVAIAEQGCSHAGVEVRRVDVGTGEGRALAARHGIRGVPTFLFLDRDGAEVSRRIGEQPLAELQHGLEAIAGVRCAELSPGARTDSPTGAGI